jgi:hypothetical protein
LDISTAELAEQDHIEAKQRAHLAAAVTAYRESANNTPTSRASTLSSRASVIQIQPSPQILGSHDQEIADQLAESLHINRPMSCTVTMEVPAGTINPIMGHMENDNNIVLHHAIGPDQPDPPSLAVQGHTLLEYCLDGLEKGPHIKDHLEEELHQKELQYPCQQHQLFLLPHTTQNWSATHPLFLKEKDHKLKNSSPNGSYTKGSISITPS